MRIRLIARIVRDGVESIRQFGLRETLADVPAYLHELVFRMKAQSEQVEAFDLHSVPDTACSVMPWDLPSLKNPGLEGFQLRANLGATHT